MTSEESERLLFACGLQGVHDMERLLLHEGISEVRPYNVGGTADTYEFVFESGGKAAFKSIEGADRNASGYGHTATSVVLNDFSAWLVARGMGYEHLLRGVVVTTCSLTGVSLGSLQHWFLGEPSGEGWRESRHLREAALFDALIGHQDRNGSNFKYEQDEDELGLYDNSFAFARPGDPQSGSSDLVAAAREETPELEDDLIEALNRFENSEEREALEHILEPDRFQRLLVRSGRMRQEGALLEAFEF